MKSFAFSTIKGGVGKTTLSIHTASAFADAGRSVLFIDLDPQAHGSLALGLEPAERPCVGDTFGPRAKHTLKDVVVRSEKRENLFIAPAVLRMAAMERDLYHWGYRLEALSRSLDTLGWQPDVVVIDTPPSIGPYTEAVMHFVDVLVAPVPTGAYALQGLTEISNTWKQVRERGGQLVVAVNMWDRRTSATNEAMEQALSEITFPVLKTRIPRSEAINQAGLAYEVVFDTARTANGADELKGLAKELAKVAGVPSPVRRRTTGTKRGASAFAAP
ncbi:MAG: ParA family protein [Myxococcaceae bacterium]|nr:ParA family protein [Myxococcaceae bacterium]